MDGFNLYLMSDNLRLHGPNTRYAAIDPTLFVRNRARLAALLAPNAMVVVHANDVMPSNGDGLLPFVQNSDFFYLTGIPQEETILVMYPDAGEARYRTMLFVQDTTREIAVWEGAKYTHVEAREASGIEEVHSLAHFGTMLDRLMKQVDCVYLPTNEHLRARVVVQGKQDRFIRWCQEKYPLHQYRRLAPCMKKLRMVKSRTEIDLIRQACKITETALKEAIRHVRPGMKEYEVEALLAGSLTRQGSEGFAFSPIVASGDNTCVLHYMANNQRCKAGDLLLLDVGATYAHYHADLTRVVPVGGRFTDRQKAVYHAVHGIMEEAKKRLVIGKDLRTYHDELAEVMEEALLSLGLLTAQEVQAQDRRSPAYKRYCMHGVSHHLGLDTHDVADEEAKLAPGMVLTIEPGIYIPEEGIGIRLENDFVVRKEGVEDLVTDLPLLPEAIEEMMGG